MLENQTDNNINLKVNCGVDEMGKCHLELSSRPCP